MIRRSIVVLVLLAGTCLAGAQQSAAQTSFLTPLKAQWDSTRNLVTGIVGQVPEDKYDYRPTPETRSFREQFTHLIGENYRFMAQAAGEPAPLDQATADKFKSRDEIVKALADSYEYGDKVWATMDDKKAMEMIAGRGGQQQMRWSAILVNIIDNMDHYGNLVTMVRLNGMVPGRTAAQQQQRQQQAPPAQR
ncbi:MAG: DinB family protein [Acidobacteria bacterium]|nr:DinB family protein [Acidobacteriota bacterium]